uniref:Carboxymethylenebutenolidase homolog n=1 Tax=Athene cunicularia TaxID=194338 RepID=A0A663MX95_ATHCN
MANESRPCPCDIGDRFDCEGCGQEVQVEHIKAYICKAAASTDKAVIVIHDIFGWQLPNTRYTWLILFGELPSAQDFFSGGEAWKPSDDWSEFNDWLKTRDARKINKEANAALKYLKEQCGAKKLGVVVFCWGGIAARHLMMTYAEFRAGVSLYGRVAAWNMALLIQLLLHSILQVNLLKQKLKKNCKVDYEVNIYPGQTHGFVHSRREDISPQDKPYIEEGRKDMIRWLNKYI